MFEEGSQTSGDGNLLSKACWTAPPSDDDDDLSPWQHGDGLGDGGFSFSPAMFWPFVDDDADVIAANAVTGVLGPNSHVPHSFRVVPPPTHPHRCANRVQGT